MTTEQALPCPVCAGASPKAPAGSWKEYRLYDCSDCGVGFCLPFKNPGNEYYGHHTDMYPHDGQQTTDPMSFEYDEAISFLSRRLEPGRRLLDVGCGGGGFLNRARGLGLEVAGLDFNRERLDSVRSRLGLRNLFCGGIEEFAQAQPGRHFDAISMFQVLEHLDNPGRWVDLVRSCLEPGGYFLVGVPNRERTFDPFQGPGMEDVDTPPHHLTRWSARALRAFLEGHGFKVLDLRSLDVPQPLLALMLRNRLRFGVATRALNVDQLQHAPSAPGKGGLLHGAIRGMVAAKEVALNSAAWLAYPGLLLARRAFGWQGVVLYCAAQRAP